MMEKICVIIPACNEEKTIGQVISQIPNHFSPSISKIVVVDAGTTDNTAAVAQASGAKVLNLGSRRGLAEAFRAGLKEALKESADIIVTIDADGQYSPKDVPRIVAPILTGEANVVLGSRFNGGIEDMPISKKLGNIFFTLIIRILTKVPLTDSQTGFRAMTSNVARNLDIKSDYTYTQEMILNTAFMGFRIKEEPIFFAKRRHGESRLIPHPLIYALRATKTIIKSYMRNLLKAKRRKNNYLCLSS